MKYFIHEIDVGMGKRTLRAYLPDVLQDSYYKALRPAVIILPGGAYGITYEGEAEPIALKFVSEGVCAFLLDYSVTSRSEKVWPYAQMEAFAAIRYVRRHASEFGIRPDNIATLGFSAGGHLCACTGTLWNKPGFAPYMKEDNYSARPDKLILCYSVIRAFEPCEKGSFHNLFGVPYREIDRELLNLVSVERQVDDETPPSFIWILSDDTSVPIQGVLEFAHALADHDTFLELHIYPHGGHGLCAANHVTGQRPYEEACTASDWMKHAVRFLFDEKVTQKLR